MSGGACQCKRGFFTLRDCPNQGQQTCGVCNRSVCTDHLASRVDARVCLECAARQEERMVTQVGDEAAPLDLASPERRYRLRDRLYRGSGYDPVFWGRYYDDSYTDYNLRHFDDDETYEGGFGDS